MNTIYDDILPLQTAIFMGCGNGEIELGMSNGSSQVRNFEFELKKLIPGDFPQEVLLARPLDQARASSSPSSLRSLSMENNLDCPHFLFNTLQTSSRMPDIYGFKEPISYQQATNQIPSTSTMRSEDPLQEVLLKIRTNHLIPSREDEEAVMTRAILAVISSSSSHSPPSSSSHLRAPQASSTAFKKYQTYFGPKTQVQNLKNINRISLSFFRNLSEARTQQQNRSGYTNLPTSNQLHHMISERKRREKLNESFQDLRSLLPPDSKKDKASVLANIKEYIDSLNSQLDELNKRNKILEAEQKQILNQDSGERVNIKIKDVEESSLDSQVVDLEVDVRGNSILMDLVTRVLDLMNRDEAVSVMSIDAGTRMLETKTITNLVVLRLRIQGCEWNRSSFQQALIRVLDDLP
ncbi:hypothetical protein SSX86_006293 [Deinandra increscens subsp. villosa]|uniref:BHLH domain-containing protein n=1 Tax=Deinandra increscens subsp. villosa TaxID=3103831 RepID=A0AAP0DEZ7_9ASTR